MGFISNFVRVNRAGKIATKTKELQELENKPRKTTEDNKQIAKLTGQVARLEEKNKIASENNTRSVNNVNSNNKTITQKNGIFAKFTYHKSKKI